MQITGRGEDMLPGQVTAQDKQSLRVPRVIIGATGDDSLFLLKVSGSTPAGAGIVAGDWAVVRKQHTAEPGDIIASMSDGDDGDADAVVRRYGDGTPAPIILGKITAILRRTGDNSDQP
jgi:SOS-response transcriptional repressor LexA